MSRTQTRLSEQFQIDFVEELAVQVAELDALSDDYAGRIGADPRMIVASDRLVRQARGFLMQLQRWRKQVHTREAVDALFEKGK